MAKRRANGEGNIRKRSDGRWEGRYMAGHVTSGKPSRKDVLGKTQAGVKAKLKAAIEKSQTLDISRTDEYTVEKWMRTWYELYPKPNIREATLEKRSGHLAEWTVPKVTGVFSGFSNLQISHFFA